MNITNEEILEVAKQTNIPLWAGTDDPEFVVELLAFARLIEQATREVDIAIAHDFVQYHMDFDKADECAKEMRNQK